DAEIIAAMSDSLSALGLRFRIRISSRKILNSLVALIGLPAEMARPLFRIVDKLDKQGLEAVKQELGPGRTDRSGAEIKGLGLGADQIQRIEEFLDLPSVNRTETLNALETHFEGFDIAEEGINELWEIHHNLDALGISDESAVIDASVARGLDYYTGPVYEAVLIGAEKFGSVMGGGRYDTRIGLFTGQDIAATGASIGVDRLLSAMRKLEMVETKPSTADVLITVMDRERMADYQRIARQLRLAGINTELYLGNKKGIKQQLKYADRLAIPIAVIIGSDEFDAGEVSIKDLRLISEQEIDIQDRQTYLEARVAQKTIPITSMVEEIKHWLKL
ncbi:MAG: ATP phosphoribosyltransferase regulatory subunit, partial [Candidatus Electryoneaceae bacterium]|nr:ATP phosphoribosyltransferase regulatory subunit [Candidatus Electryoneaceae bacterium]